MPDSPPPVPAPPTLAERQDDAAFLLQYLRQSAREERSIHLMDVRAALLGALTGDFNDYLKFLRHFDYVAVDRATHDLGLTEAGERATLSQDSAFIARLREWFQATEPKPVPFTVSFAQPPPPPPPDPEHLPDDEPFTHRLVLSRSTHVLTSRATHEPLARPVVVRECLTDDADVQERFFTSVRAQAAMAHPCVVKVHDVLVRDSSLRAVFPYCEGGNLRERLRVDGPLPFPLALGAASQILSAVAAFHAQDVLQLDISPDRVLFDLADNALLTLPALAPSADRRATPYWAPELRAGQTEPAVGSDLYATGVVVYEMLVGEPYTPSAPLPSIAGEGVPAPVDEVIERLVAREVEARYSSAEEALLALQSAFPREARASTLDVRVRI